MGKKPGRTPELLAKFSRYAEWYFTPKNERKPPTTKEMCAQLDVSEVTGQAWRHELEDEVGYKSDEQKEWYDHLRKTAFGGNSRALELLGKAKGFIEKKTEEDKVLELTANEYYAILREARNRVQDVQTQPGGDGSMPDELPVLHEEVCEDTDEIEAAEDDTVGELAVPDRPDRPDPDSGQSDNSQSSSTGDIVVSSGVCLMADSI